MIVALEEMGVKRTERLWPNRVWLNLVQRRSVHINSLTWMKV